MVNNEILATRGNRVHMWTMAGAGSRIPMPMHLLGVLKPAEFTTFAALIINYHARRACCHASIRQLARTVGVSPQTASAAIKGLVAKGFVEVDGLPGTTNDFFFTKACLPPNAK